MRLLFALLLGCGPADDQYISVSWDDVTYETFLVQRTASGWSASTSWAEWQGELGMDGVFRGTLPVPEAEGCQSYDEGTLTLPLTVAQTASMTLESWNSDACSPSGLRSSGSWTGPVVEQLAYAESIGAQSLDAMCLSALTAEQSCHTALLQARGDTGFYGSDPFDVCADEPPYDFAQMQYYACVHEHFTTLDCTDPTPLEDQETWWSTWYAPECDTWR